MEPTNRFRWVVRLTDSTRSGPVREKVLQQWWRASPQVVLPPYGQWRDVPVEDERDSDVADG